MNIHANLCLYLILILLLIGCNRPKKETRTKLHFTTATDSLKMLFPGSISTHLYERDFALSPDRNEIMYTIGNFDQSKRTLVHIKKENGTWEKKQILTLSGTYQDIEPFFSPDGEQLFFASNRPIYGDDSRNDYNIWVSMRINNQWSSPKPLDSIINTRGDEFYPAVSSNGNLYFTATRKDGLGLEDIFFSSFKKGSYQRPKVLSKNINSTSYEFNAYINPTENLLIYSSYGRKDGLGGGDLYYSKKDSLGKWKPAVNFGKTINSKKLDFSPYYDAQNKVLYFSSTREKFPTTINSIENFIKVAESPLNGMSNIYRISIQNLLD